MFDLIADAHDAMADVMEIGAAWDWINPLVAFMERCACPFGCALIGISLDSARPPAYYERLLIKGGVEVKGIEPLFLDVPRIGDYIHNGYACITIVKKHLQRAVRILDKAGASFVY